MLHVNIRKYCHLVGVRSDGNLFCYTVIIQSFGLEFGNRFFIFFVTNRSSLPSNNTSMSKGGGGEMINSLPSL